MKQPPSQQSIDIDEILDDLPNAWCEVCEHPQCIGKKQSVKQALLEVILSCIGEDEPEKEMITGLSIEDNIHRNQVKADIRQAVKAKFKEVE